MQAGGLGGGVHEVGAGMRLLVREVAIGVAQPLAQRVAQARQDAAQAAAIRAEVVGIDHKIDAVARIAAAARVVARRIDLALKLGMDCGALWHGLA